MIRVEVEDYCHECLDFHPDVTPATRLRFTDSEYSVIGDTVIRCEYRKRCAAITRFLENRAKDGK